MIWYAHISRNLFFFGGPILSLFFCRSQVHDINIIEIQFTALFPNYSQKKVYSSTKSQKRLIGLACECGIWRW